MVGVGGADIGMRKTHRGWNYERSLALGFLSFPVLVLYVYRRRFVRIGCVDKGISAMRWRQGWIFWGRKLGVLLESVIVGIYVCTLNWYIAVKMGEYMYNLVDSVLPGGMLG